MTTRYLFSILCGFAATVSAAHAADTAQYPTKPIRLVVPFTPSGSAEFTARWIAQRLSEQSGQSAVVENRTGASGTIATARAASPPDGYTLLVMTATDTVQPALRE